jgi:hypothetical protein
VTLFNWLPRLKYVGYLLPDTLVLYPPLSLAKLNGSEDATGTSPESATAPSPLLLPSPTVSAAGQSSQDSYRKRGRRHLKRGLKYFNEERVIRRGISFTLSVASRRDFAPSFKIRKSRVEDCDDLMPMLKRQNVTLCLFKISCIEALTHTMASYSLVTRQSTFLPSSSNPTPRSPKPLWLSVMEKSSDSLALVLSLTRIG